MWNTRINAFKKQRLMPSAVMLVGIVPHWFSLDAVHWQRIVYERFNPCKQTNNDDCNTFRVSIWQQRMRKSSRSCLLLWVSACVCQHRKNQPTLWPGSWGELGRGHALIHALTLALLSTLFFCLHVWKDSSGLLSHFKHSCGRWRCLKRTFLSHSGVCFSIKKQTQAWK